MNSMYYIRTTHQLIWEISIEKLKKKRMKKMEKSLSSQV